MLKYFVHITQLSGYKTFKISDSESSTITGFSQSTDDLTHIYRTIESENLTFDGKDKQKQRRSAIKSESSGDGLPSGVQVEKVKKLHSLERTLKVSL